MKKKSCYYFWIRRASLTVESAVVLPLFLLGMITVIFIMRVYKIQLEENVRLSQTAMDLSVMAHVKNLTGGFENADTSGEDFTGDYIDLTIPGKYYLPVSLIPNANITYISHARIRKWIGYDGNSLSNDYGEMVYVTENGSVYHTHSDCSYIDISIESLLLKRIDEARNSYGGKYGACEKCCKGTLSCKTVYVTPKGDRYHSMLSCSSFKRSVRLVCLSEVGGLGKCSRCAARD